jgi:uncharacterized membrane protein YphA (DoxX/SURF4 family)
MSSDSPTGGPSWGLVLVRIVLGGLLLAAAWVKLSAGYDENLVLGARERIAAAPELYRAFGESVVLMHPWFFAQCIVFGELLGGLALFLGALTRPAGFLVAFQFANFAFAAPQEQTGFVSLIAVCALGCAISRAGRKAGADVFLDAKLPGWITWTRGG